MRSGGDSVFEHFLKWLVCVCVCLYLLSGGAEARDFRLREPLGL